jgi:hypothetical protein
MKKIIVILFVVFSLQSNVHSAETYMYGSGKYFGYGIEKSDLQALNTSLIALGYSSSLSETDNSGIGFDIGFGATIADNVSLEAGYVNYGTLTINTTLTGPSEKVKLEIDGNGVTAAVKLDLEGYYVKGGMHSWDFEGKISTTQGSSSEALGSGTDPFFGIGFGADGFEAGYEYYGLDDGNISALTIRFSHKF